MSSIFIATLVFASTLAGGMAGIALGSRLPAQHRDTDSRDVVKLVMGLIASVTALVLSLLVSSAHSSFDAQDTEVRQLAVHVVQLDRALARFGPDADDLRKLLRSTLEADVARAWPHDGTVPMTMAAQGSMKAAEDLFERIVKLPVKNEADRFAHARAMQLLTLIGDTRRLLGEQARGSLSWPFLVVLVFWLTLLFLGFGLFARFNRVVIGALLVGSISVSGAIFLILEMNHPYGGVMQISDVPLREAIGQLGK